MRIFEKLFGRTRKERLKAPCWQGVPPVGDPMDQKPDVIEGFRTTSFRTNDTQHALLALALSTTNFHGIGPEGFYLFDLQGDATIVSKLSDSSMSVLDLQGGGDLEVTTHKMPTYPILRACLHWKRKDGRFLTQENILDVRWVDVQRFFKGEKRGQRKKGSDLFIEYMDHAW